MTSGLKFERIFTEFVKENKLFQKGQPVLLAVSGGPDSVVMCHLFHKSGFQFGIAHCNFKLRGKDSDKDEAFVKNLAKDLDVGYWTENIPIKKYADEHSVSTQMAARVMRYEWLEKIRKDNDFHSIAVGHHRNDVAETMLLNFIKGAGIYGLHGIKPKQVLHFNQDIHIIRPILFSSKEEIKQYIKSNNIACRHDKSNDGSKYQRNKIRNEVMPLLKEINPKLDQTLYDNSQRFEEIESLYLMAVHRLKNKMIIPMSGKKRDQDTSTHFKISISKLKPLNAKETMLFEILKGYGFNTTLVREITEGLDGISGKQFLSSTHRVIKDRKYLIVQPIEEKGIEPVLFDQNDKKVEAGGITFTIKNKAVSPGKSRKLKISSDSNIAHLDLKKLDFPLLLRNWEKGDYFYPYGLTKGKNGKAGKKKIGHFLIDMKVPLSEKENVKVITSGKKICWVAGYRIDDRFKIDNQTTNILVIEIKTEKSKKVKKRSVTLSNHNNPSDDRPVNKV